MKLSAVDIKNLPVQGYTISATDSVVKQIVE
jgi:hypothetical protein